jgi:hypothetical protein
MKRLLFSRVDVEIFEDVDFPDDPAPYARIRSRDPEFIIEIEEARDLARALGEWVREIEERERRQERARRRELKRRAVAPIATPALEEPPGMTLLELVARSKR